MSALKVASVTVLGVATAACMTLVRVIPGGGLNGLLASWVAIGAAALLIGRHGQLTVRVAFATSAIVALVLTAAVVRRDLVVYLAIVGVETLAAGGAAAIGAATSRRHRNRLAGIL